MRAELIQLTVATLGRAPSPQEMTSWLAQLNSGTSLSALAQGLMFDEGGIGRFAGVSNTDILVNAYQALFGRLPDVSGLNYWLNEFAAGRVDLGNLIPSLMVGALASTGNSNDALILAARAQAANSFLQAAEESGVFNPQAAAQAVAAVLRSSVAEPGDEPSKLYDPEASTPTPTGPEEFTVAQAVAIVADPSKSLPDEYDISDIATAFQSVAVADVPTPEEEYVIAFAANVADFVWSLKDAKAALLDPANELIVFDVDHVEATDALNAAEAAELFAINTSSTYTVEDTLAGIRAEYKTDPAPFTNATSWTLTDAPGPVSPALADVADTAVIVNGATNAASYTIEVSDTAAAIVAAIGGSVDLSDADSIEHTGAQGGATGVASVADTFVFANGADATITTFTNGEDVIDLSAFVTGSDVAFQPAANNATIDIVVTDDGTDTTIGIEGAAADGTVAHTITLTGVSGGVIDVNDFVFA